EEVSVAVAVFSARALHAHIEDTIADIHVLQQAVIEWAAVFWLIFAFLKLAVELLAVLFIHLPGLGIGRLPVGRFTADFGVVEACAVEKRKTGKFVSRFFLAGCLCRQN